MQKCREILFGLSTIGILFASTSCERNATDTAHNQLQTLYEREVSKAVGRFSNKLPADTLDFASLTPFDWDTVYVFEGNTLLEIKLPRDFPNIKWNRVMDDDPVPEKMNRFIFVKDQKAIDYIDIKDNLVIDAHYTKYYQIEPGHYSTELTYFNSKGQPHNYNSSHLSRVEAKFILVRHARIPQFSASFYCTLPYFLNDKTLQIDSLKTDYMMFLHPVIGCGLPNCLGNDSTKQRVGSPNRHLKLVL